MIEKRSSPRAQADFVVELYESDGRTLIGIARLLNLSQFGCCIESISTLTEKADYTIRLLLGKRHLLTLPVTVIWIQQRPHLREYGVQFGAIPGPVKGMIQKFIEEYFKENQEMGLGLPPAPQKSEEK